MWKTTNKIAENSSSSTDGTAEPGAAWRYCFPAYIYGILIFVPLEVVSERSIGLFWAGQKPEPWGTMWGSLGNPLLTWVRIWHECGYLLRSCNRVMQCTKTACAISCRVVLLRGPTAAISVHWCAIFWHWPAAGGRRAAARR